MVQEVVSTVEAAKDIQIYNYFILSAFTFLIYDHVLTFGEEVKYYWGRPINKGASWFFINRYFAFFGNIIAISFEWVDFPPAYRLLGCFVFDLFREMVVIIDLLIVCAILIIRTYALYNRSLVILVFLLVTGFLLIGIALWFTFGGSSDPITNPNLRGCYTGLTLPQAIHYVVGFEANMLFDTIIFFLTAFRTWKSRKAIRLDGHNVSLVALMLRDGALYYGAMALVNFVNVMSTYFNRPYLRGCFSTFSSGMCVTLMSRLMLNLHVNTDSVYIHFDHNSSFASSQRQKVRGQAPSGELKFANPGRKQVQESNDASAGSAV